MISTTTLSRIHSWAGPALLGLLASVLVLSNLGNQFLWQDEAQTALVGRTILSEGLPRGYDGINHFSQDLGAEYGRNYLWKWHPWFPFYVLAAFFGLFGTSTFIARLPFALFGLGTVILAYRLAAPLADGRRAGYFSALLLAASVPFLLLSRQCRYYAPEMFFCAAVLFCHLRGMETGSRRHFAWYALCLVLLFHTHQLFFGVCLVVTVAHGALFHRSRLKALVAAASGAALINAPWLLWVYNVDYSKVHPAILTVENFIALMIWNSKQIARHLVGPALAAAAALALFLLATKRARPSHSAISAGSAWGLYVIFIAAGLAAASAVSYGFFFRNLAPLVPAFAVAGGGVLGLLGGLNRYIPVGFIALHLALSPLPDYLYEITHDYDGPIKGIVIYLNANATKSDVVGITYGDLPVKWYTGLRVVGGLTGESLEPLNNARWIIFRKHSISEKDFLVKMQIARFINPAMYTKVVIDYPDIPFENREEPDLHLFRTARAEDRVVIFRRK